MLRAHKEPSTFFGYRARQRILVALAHLGPLRLREVLDLADSQEDAVLRFLRSGIIVKYGNAQAKMLALNPRLPAFKEFKALVRAIEPSPQAKPRLKRVKGEIAFPEVDTRSLRDLCGGWHLTATVLNVAASDGTIKTEDLRRALRFQRTNSVQRARLLQTLVDRNIISIKRDNTIISDRFPAAPQLIAYAKALLKVLPEFDLRGDAKEWQPATSGTKRHGLIDWKRDEGQAERPSGIGPSNDGTPLLFGTVSRFRTLTSLAVNGSMRPADLVAANRMNPSTYRLLLSDGWIGRSSASRGRTTRAVVDISSALPARDEYIALLRKLAEKWPPRKIDHTSGGGAVMAHSEFDIGKCFGSVPRTETLLTLAAMGSADVSTIRHSASSTDYGAVRRTILMLQHYGIVRYTEREGSAKMVELDPTWFAAAELRTLLDALIPIDGRYAGRANSAEGEMTEKRVQMRDNARKRSAKAKADPKPRRAAKSKRNGAVLAPQAAPGAATAPKPPKSLAEVLASIRAGGGR